MTICLILARSFHDQKPLHCTARSFFHHKIWATNNNQLFLDVIRSPIGKQLLCAFLHFAPTKKLGGACTNTPNIHSFIHSYAQQVTHVLYSIWLKRTAKWAGQQGNIEINSPKRRKTQVGYQNMQYDQNNSEYCWNNRPTRLDLSVGAAEGSTKDTVTE